MIKSCALILAAGEGKRMKSEKPKTLLKVLNKPMLGWVVGAVKNSGILNICIITGFGSNYVEQYLKSLNFEEKDVKLSTVFQEKRLGTGHAVLAAKSFLQNQDFEDIAILNGDSPLLDSKTIKSAYYFHKSKQNSATIISSKLSNPFGYGRIIRKEGKVCAVIEQRDADEETLKINEVNSGAYWFKKKSLISILNLIKNNNAQHEYYLTDAIRLLISKKEKVDSFESESENLVLGVNDLDQLKKVNKIVVESVDS